MRGRRPCSTCRSSSACIALPIFLLGDFPLAGWAVGVGLFAVNFARGRKAIDWVARGKSQVTAVGISGIGFLLPRLDVLRRALRLIAKLRRRARSAVAAAVIVPRLLHRRSAGAPDPALARTQRLGPDPGDRVIKRLDDVSSRRSSRCSCSSPRGRLRAPTEDGEKEFEPIRGVHRRAVVRRCGDRADRPGHLEGRRLPLDGGGDHRSSRRCGSSRGGLQPATRSRLQTVVETIYTFARPNIGKATLPRVAFARWFPYLVSLFLFIWILNMISFIPLPLDTHNTSIGDIPGVDDLRGDLEHLGDAGADADDHHHLARRGHARERRREVLQELGARRSRRRRWTRS